MHNAHPHDVRLAARDARYPNSETERATCAAVDDAVFDRVRIFERQQTTQGETLRDTMRAALADQSLVESLREHVRYPLLDAPGVTPDAARSYERLRRRTEERIAHLRRLDQEAAWLGARAADPYRAYCDLMTRWPLVRPALPT